MYIYIYIYIVRLLLMTSSKHTTVNANTDSINSTNYSAANHILLTIMLLLCINNTSI